MEDLLTIETAANSIIKNSPNKPSPDSVVSALIQIEKQSKKQENNYSIEQLSGNWQLCFITGTKKTRKRAGTVLGAGRYIPNWVKITLSYFSPLNTSETPEKIEIGRVENTVEFAGFKLSLSGTTKFIDKKNILAFDFTKITVKLLGVKLYSGYIRGGQESEDKFATESVGKQAFFAYFLIQEKFIAARGRGGGLAIWRKLKN
ncbi:MAG: hypothetical protein F6K54_23435 [Okeania sp. SIO3B5]|uniref:hypothetical protein n=1 Tax=Okeania sp. SIO3B5 TaxID=2607811 RepID=UPI0013FFCCCC|nr:hypothetical protein [Okeania sp. SIO3B5]NEO55763.1 hypothetical protein [Okeania sp. SIO3B5]